MSGNAAGRPPHFLPVRAWLRCSRQSRCKRRGHLLAAWPGLWRTGHSATHVYLYIQLQVLSFLRLLRASAPICDKGRASWGLSPISTFLMSKEPCKITGTVLPAQGRGTASVEPWAWLTHLSCQQTSAATDTAQEVAMEDRGSSTHGLCVQPQTLVALVGVLDRANGPFLSEELTVKRT